jgi:hypothetical protein
LNCMSMSPYCTFMLHVMLIVRAACLCCLSMLLVHAACPYLHAAYPCCVSMLYIHVSLLQVHVSMPHVHVAMLHVHAVCPCCLSICLSMLLVRIMHVHSGESYLPTVL